MPVIAEPASRALGPGSRRRAAVLGGTLVLIAAIGLLVALSGSNGPRHATRRAAARYGGLPSWLPKPTVKVGRTAQASLARPWPAIEGDTVSVHLAGARVLVTAVGPQVPAQGHFPVPSTTPCRFLVTFAAASAPIPLQPAAFTIADELHRLHHPRVSVLGGGPLPARVGPGQHLTIALDEVLPTGNGQLRWSPATAKPIVSWDFSVEID